MRGKSIAAASALVLFAPYSTNSLAERDMRVALNPAYQQECGSCHVPFPPALLDETSWKKLLNNLEQHFGSDASLEAGPREQIARYLTENASRRPRLDVAGKPTLRITDTAWFRHEHDEVGAAVWKRPAVKSASNCAACHSRAESGSFSEREIHIAK